mmetsp:Transcript_17429/g.43452  ORF Transcript_17429/g.43452 Transcript_17429/m.43452 type:complete len:94 (-) Transcript_17429:13-294(-)
MSNGQIGFFAPSSLSPLAHKKVDLGLFSFYKGHPAILSHNLFCDENQYGHLAVFSPYSHSPISSSCSDSLFPCGLLAIQPSQNRAFSSPKSVY